MLLPQFRKTLPALLLGLLLTPVLQGQQDLDEALQASVALDLRMDRLVSQAQELGINCDQMLQQVEGPEFLRQMKATDLVRIYGAFSLPTSLDAVMQPEGDPPPFHFFLRIKFASPEAAQMVIQEISSTGGTVEIDGKEYFVENEERPRAMMAHLVSADELEFGTGSYLLLDHRKVMSVALQDTWNRVPDDAFRLAMEMQTAKRFITEATEMGQQQLPPSVEPFLGLVKNVASLNFSIDLKNTNLMTLVIEGTDESAATELKGALDSLFGMAKLFGASQLEELREEAPAMSATGQAILAALGVKQQGTRVSLEVPRPAELAAAMEEMDKLSANAAQEMATVNDFRQAALAVHNYYDVHRKFPFRNARNVNPELSWRVLVLPYLEQMVMYKEMDTTKGPGEEPNAQFADQMPLVYGADGSNSQIVWVESEVEGFPGITDGTSNTIMLLQVPEGQPWMESGGISQADAAKLIAELPEGEFLNAAFYDGSVRRLSSGMDLELLHRLLNPRDGEPVEWDF